MIGNIGSTSSESHATYSSPNQGQGSSNALDPGTAVSLCNLRGRKINDNRRYSPIVIDAQETLNTPRSVSVRLTNLATQGPPEGNPDTYDFEALKAHILPLSVNQSNFQAARLEWGLAFVTLSEETKKCPCKHPIRELCHIRNERNGQETYVGNVCVNKFLGIQTGNLFTGLKRIHQNPDANPNRAVIDYAVKAKLITQGEQDFLISRMRTRKSTERQRAWKAGINARITKATSTQSLAATLHDGLAEIRNNRNVHPSTAVIEHAKTKSLINEREYGFLKDTVGVQRLSEKQIKWMSSLNAKILRGSASTT